MRQLTLKEAMMLALGDIRTLLFTYKDIFAVFRTIGPEYESTPETSIRRTITQLLADKKLKRIGRISGTTTAVYSRDMNMLSLEPSPWKPPKQHAETTTALDEDMSIDEVMHALKDWILAHVDNADGLHHTINGMQETLVIKNEEMIELKKNLAKQLNEAVAGRRAAEADLRTITQVLNKHR